jgi:hypothetical protein
LREALSIGVTDGRCALTSTVLMFRALCDFLKCVDEGTLIRSAIAQHWRACPGGENLAARAFP